MELSVKVLMSTYNGEQYLQEQIDSLLCQEGVLVDIVIRDDGSSDNTVDLLKKYESENSNIHVIVSDNIGPSKSFMELLFNADSNYDYYAFSDQDDIWESNKIIHAIERIEQQNINVPILYYSSLMTFDSETGVKKLINRGREYSFDETLLKSFFPGCTMVFNKNAFELVKSVSKPEKVIMHDLFLMQLMMGTDSTIIYDEESFINYRVHGNNFSVKPDRIWGRIRRLYRILKKQKGLRSSSAGCTLSSLKSVLNETSKSSLRIAATYKESISNKKQMLDLIMKTKYSFGVKSAFVTAVVFNFY